MKWMFGTFLTVLIVLAVFSPTPSAALDSVATNWTYDPQTPNAPCPSMPACDLWLKFRTAHPWPYQTFAVEQSGAEAVIIISEPPPVLSREQLAQTLNALFQDNLLGMTYYRWPTGLDGWMEDVVLRVRVTDPETAAVTSGATLAPWQASKEIVDRLRLLHQLFYHTSDGLWVDHLTEGGDASPIPEVKVLVSDLAGWLADSSRVWTRAFEPTNQRTTRQLYAEKLPGVFYSNGGLVALIAPRDMKLNDLAADFRRFAVSTDLIFGASGLKSGGLMLFGRLRQISITNLPPLRFETLASFARSPSAHLAQSYERQRIFAGRIETGKYGGWDWAPILLSPQLDDSEFGTLLNLADQILKSWSEHGQVNYYAFAYGKPEHYPFGDVSASQYFAEKFLTTSLLFNWNTEGLATVTTVNGKEILTSDRTGALPILYRASNGLLEESGVEQFSKRQADEDADARAKEARDYFAALGDPILIRVLQNVLLYQAAQSFLVRTDGVQPSRVPRSDLVNSVLEQRAVAWLSEITRGNSDADRDTQTKLTNFMKTSGVTREKLAHILASPQSVERDLQRALQQYRSSTADLKWTVSYLEQAQKRADDLFFTTCNSVSGQIKKTLTGDEQCVWKGRLDESSEEVFSTYVEYSKSVDKMETDGVAMLKSAEAAKLELISLSETYTQAAELAKTLSHSSRTVDLDDVLREVLEATSATSVPGFIRTPSVVLSKNSVDVESIGGHNIDLIPQRRLVEPTIPPIAGRPRPIPGPREMPPPRPDSETLGVARAGNLLDEIRATASKAEKNTGNWPSIMAKAKGCQCEALIVQGDDGEIYFVRNAPPPGRQTIFGKSGVIDALAAPPPIHVARFEGFPASTVENISRSTALITSGPREGVFNRGLDGISGLFKQGEAHGNEVSVTIERAGESEVLRLSEDSSSMASLKEPISWHNSTIETATPARWTETFGDEAKLDAASDAVIVRFGKPGIAPGWLGVRVQVESGSRTGITGRLRAVMSQWLGSQPLTPVPWADSMVDLRAAIKRQLKPIDLEFYYQRNKAKIRAAQLGRRNGCSKQRCGA